MIPKTCGDLRTRVRVGKINEKRLPGETSATKEWIDIGNSSGADPPKYKYCLWVGFHGNEVFALGQVIAEEQATLTFRYDKRITTACKVIFDGKEYNIISVDHIRQKGQWTEIKVKRGKTG